MPAKVANPTSTRASRAAPALADSSPPATLVWGAVAVLALAVRLAHVWAIHGAPLFDHLISDGRVYDAWAQRIAAGDWLGSGVFYQAPLYPYFLGAIYACVGRDLVVVRVVQAVLGSAACVLLGIAGGRFFSRRVGYIAAVALALWPSAFFADALIQKSALDSVLLCGLLAALAYALQEPRVWSWLTAGGALGGLVLTRENALAFVPVLLIGLFFHFRNTPWAPARLRAAAAFLLGLTLMLLPVAFRNHVVSGEWHLTTAQFGPNIYIGNNPAATGLSQPLRAGRSDPMFEQLDATELAEHALGRSLTPGEVSQYWTARTRAFITAQPGRWLQLLARKTVLLVNRVEVGDAEDQYTYGEWSRGLAFLGPILNFGLLMPLAAAGVVLSWPRRRAIGVLLALLGIYALTVIATFVMARYRYPLLPLLLLFAAAGVVEAMRCVRTQQGRRLVPAMMVALCVAIPANWPVISESTVRATTLYNIGRSIQDDADGLDRSIEYYRKAVALDPEFALAESNLGTALQNRGQLTEAVEHLRRAVALQPAVGDRYYNLAAALAAVGDTDGAAAAYTRALELDPNDADAHSNLGVLLQSRGALQEAIKQFKAAITINPRHMNALNNLGVTYAQQGNLDLAIQTFRSAIAIDPSDPSASENLATALAAAQRAGASGQE